MGRSNLPLFHFAESYNDSDQYYLTGFMGPDPFAVLEFPDGRTILGVSPMEYGRAARETQAAGVLVMSGGGRGRKNPVLGFLGELGVDHVRVLPTLPLGLARVLEEGGVTLELDGISLKERRRRKTADQIAAIEAVQRHVEEAMELIRSRLAGCVVSDGILLYEGSPLTAEGLRSLVDIHFLERGVESKDSIIAPGKRSADPHWRGTGPVRAGVPLVVDLFPRDKSTRYHSDMSRTFVLGRASDAVRRMHDAVIKAQDAALSRLEPGVRLSEIHKAVSGVFSSRGFDVPGEGRSPRRGFLHGTGHGLGLDIHEAPTVSATDDILSPGDVITVEPGLYDRRTGGVRIEDVVAVMPDGQVRNLTGFDRELEIFQ